MKALLMIMIALSLAACDVRVESTETKSDTTMAITTSGAIGQRLNDVQCLNLTTGQVEVCIVGIN